MNAVIRYREGFRYQLAETYSIQTPFRPARPIVTDLIQLTESGLLTIREDYAWDGPSGPTSDTPDSLRGSLVHDAAYQLMRMGLLDLSYRAMADQFFLMILLEDGMQEERARLWYHAVSRLAGPAADPNEPDPYPVLEAPRPYQLHDAPGSRD